MNRLLALIALTVGGGLAQSTPPTAAPTWADLLQPTLEARQQACDAAIAYEKAHPSPAGQKYVSTDESAAARTGRELTDDRTTPGTQVPAGTVNRILIQLPTATAGNMCANAAHDGKTVQLSRYGSVTLVYIQGELVALKDALTQKAALRLLDAGGGELARLESLPDAAAKVDQGLWERRCRDNVCRWVGFSSFSFNPRLKPEVLGVTQTVQLVFDRGYGQETRDYRAADFLTTGLTDSAK